MIFTVIHKYRVKGLKKMLARMRKFKLVKNRALKGIKSSIRKIK